MNPAGVSFVVPVHNGEQWLDDVLASILAQRDGRPFELMAVDDGSTDASPSILARWAARGGATVLTAERQGAAAAMNAGILRAAHPIICLIDQDVVLGAGWLSAVLDPLLDPAVGAVQGYFATDPGAPLIARVAGLDLEDRYAAMGAGPTSHVCTGNAAYRADALHRAGLFDESFGYGYDNDLSYRLMRAGYELRFCRAARSVHRWRETLGGYLRQQYGQGYGRLDIVWKHPGWAAGDAVSPAAMMAHAPLMLAAIGCGLAAVTLGASGHTWKVPFWGAAAIVGGLVLERAVAGVRVARRHHDWAGLLFPAVHLLRDAAWAAAIVAWTARRLAGRGRHPSQSMRRT